MIRPVICFVALAVVRDAETNAISAFNILEGIGAAGFPFLIQNASFFILWERDRTDPARTEASFTVRVGERDVVAAQQIVMNFEQGLRHRTIANLNGLVVPTPGSLRFRVAPQAGTAAEYAIEVSAGPPGVQLAGQARVPPAQQ